MKRGIVLLLLLYVVGVSAIVAGELTNLNGIKRSLGEPEVGYAEYFSVNAVRILTSPWVVVRELQEENQRLSQQWIERQRERSQKILESLASRGVSREGNGKTVSREDTSAKRVEEKRSTAEKRSARSYSEELRSKSLRISPSSPEARLRVTNLTLLRSYSELLSVLEEKLRRWNFKGELRIENFNGSSFAELSEEDLLTRIREQEERINELARQTGRRKIDYGGVEINRFEGDRYFVFLKKEFPEVTVAWRLLDYELANLQNPKYHYVRSPEEAREIFLKTHAKYREILNISTPRDTSDIMIYLWYNSSALKCVAYAERFRDFCELYREGKPSITGGYAPAKMAHVGNGLEGTLIHEVTHVLDKVYGMGLGYLREGFANYVRIEIWREEWSPDRVRWYEEQVYRRANPWFNHTMKEFVENTGKAGWSGNGPYDFIELFVEFLITKYGEKKFIELYSAGKGKIYRDYFTVDNFFKKVYGKSLEELDVELREWLRAKKTSAGTVLQTSQHAELTPSLYLALLLNIEDRLRKRQLNEKISLKDVQPDNNISSWSDPRIVEKESEIDKLARKTGRRKIDYGSVEVNRFEGDKYFVFLKEDYGDVTVAWRPLVQVNIAEAYKIIKETKNAYSEIMGMDDTVSYITVYLWDTRGNYHSAHKYWKSFIPGSGHAKSYNERIVAHVAPREPYSFSSRDFEALSHEFVHALDVYYWERPLLSLETLMEGFADYISKYQVFKREPKISSLNFTKATYLHYECNRGSKTCGKDYWKAYDYSYWFVKFLIENYGVEKFREIYKISDHNDYSYGWKYIDQKFQKVYGKSSGELDREMKAWAEGRD